MTISVRSQVRTTLFAGLVGFAVAFSFAACPPNGGKACGPDTCSGCCTAGGTCAGGLTAEECGQNGVACATCGTNEACGAGTCQIGTGDGGGGEDGGVGGDAGPPACYSDFDCEENEVCRPDHTCTTEDVITCQGTPATCTGAGKYCVNAAGDGVCVCFPAQKTDAGPYRSGYCKRRLAPCLVCRNSDECGDRNGILTPEARCVPFKGPDGGPGNFCLNKFDGLCNNTCGVAYVVPDAGSFCSPPEQQCLAGGFNCCAKDEDCPPERPICNRSKGRCEEACIYDYQTHQTVGCPPTLVCHVSPAWLDVANRRFGAGRCLPSCKISIGPDGGALDDAKCRTDNPGRSDYVCRPEDVGSSGGSLPRCRPSACISDFECPDQPGSNSKGYCDKSVAAGGALVTDPKDACKYDCRIGTDPATGFTYDDCKGGYKCVDTGALKTCVKKNCIESGGAMLDCNPNQYCCGESTKVACTAGVDAGVCFDISRPPWCKDCQSEADCNGGNNPNYSSVDKNACLNFGPPIGQRCLFACETQKDCPRIWRCDEIVNYCDTNADCAGADGGNGLCAQVGTTPNPDAGPQPLKACVCSSSDAGAFPCPANTRCGTDLRSWQGIDYKRCVFLRACNLDVWKSGCP